MATAIPKSELDSFTCCAREFCAIHCRSESSVSRTEVPATGSEWETWLPGMTLPSGPYSASSLPGLPASSCSSPYSSRVAPLPSALVKTDDIGRQRAVGVFASGLLLAEDAFQRRGGLRRGSAAVLDGPPLGWLDALHHEADVALVAGELGLQRRRVELQDRRQDRCRKSDPGRGSSSGRGNVADLNGLGQRIALRVVDGAPVGGDLVRLQTLLQALGGQLAGADRLELHEAAQNGSRS